MHCLATLDLLLSYRVKAEKTEPKNATKKRKASPAKKTSKAKRVKKEPKKKETEVCFVNSKLGGSLESFNCDAHSKPRTFGSLLLFSLLLH